ncbi:MAG TPA: glycosyl hydrolase family 28-related protein [Rhizomicrobium sp.]|nr:glycosyl hydrolase family 28-related protein [Rhizomicrobium sp.]
MKTTTALFAALFSILVVASAPAFAASTSVFTSKPDDPKAAYVQDFGARGDGRSDDSAALQAAIDKVATTRLGGTVFIPAGRYRLTRTIFVWDAVRLIGYGATRPVFVLADNTPGFQKGVADMVLFSDNGPSALKPGARPAAVPPQGAVPANNNVADANSGTFYSSMLNIDFEIGEGNPAAIAVRFHVAQHGVLSHMDFKVGSGLAALTQIGNIGLDLHIHGGRYGILTEKTSPAWQFTLIDSSFDGQREAAIREHEAGLTLIRDSFKDTQTAIDIDEGYYDQLWVKDCRFENIAKQALVISLEGNHQNELGFDNAVLKNVPVFAHFRESGRDLAGKGPVYRVKNFTYGLILKGEGAMGEMGTVYDAESLSAMPKVLPRAIRPLPPQSEWINVHSLGVKGDGATDDTVALQKAIDSHRVLYFPSGYYILSDTIHLKPDTVMIGLHPGTAQFDIPNDSPAFRGTDTPKPLFEVPKGGHNIMSGLGIYTTGMNPRAVAILWMAGEDSLMDDIQIMGGGGTYIAPEARKAVDNGTQNAAREDHWGHQYPSVWVNHGGGGTFLGLWSPGSYAQAGFYVTDTKTPGHVYELSNEHHLFLEIKLDHVENWEFDAPQTEEEAATSPDAVALEIDDSKNILFANYHAYRVTRSHAVFPAAVRLYHAADIHFRNVHINGESGYSVCDDKGCGTFLRVGKYPYENAIQDITHGIDTREREFASLDVPADPMAPPAGNASAVVAPGAMIEKISDGFHSISGAAVDAKGKVYFVDHFQQRIFGWSKDEGLTIERDNPLGPVNLAIDKSGEIIVQSSLGAASTVYAFRPGTTPDQITVLKPQALPHAGADLALPGNYWVNGEFRDQLDPETYRFKTLAELFAEDVTKPRPQGYVSPDGSLVLPAVRVWPQPANEIYPGSDYTGWRWSDNLDSMGFIQAQVGSRVFVSNESEDITYSAKVDADGSLSELKPFVMRGGESVATDSKGDVFVANGQILVYDPAGREIGRIDVPERPIDIVFGGADRRTLFIFTHHTLYSLRMQTPG